MWRSQWAQGQDIDLTAKWTTDGMVLLGADQLEPSASGYHVRPPVWIGSTEFHAATTRTIIDQTETMLEQLDGLLDHAPPTTPALTVASSSSDCVFVPARPIPSVAPTRTLYYRQPFAWTPCFRHGYGLG